MAVHECGHVLGAWVTEGTVTRVVVHPLAISRTDVSPNPHPRIVVWAGPVCGVLIPVLLWLLFVLVHIPGEAYLRFFAGFCLLANGGYIGLGSFERIGDAGDMINHGSPVWCLYLFGMLCMPIGLFLWHGLGPSFGLGTAQGKVDHRAAYLSLLLFLGASILSLVLSPRG